MKLFSIALLMMMAGISSGQEVQTITEGGMPVDRPYPGGDGKNTLLNGVPNRYHFLFQMVGDRLQSDPKTLRESLPFEKIRLTRSICLGMCPAYDVEFFVDGSATYNGIEFAKLDGKHTAEVSHFQFARMCWAIERVEIIDDKRMSDWVVHDTPVTTLTITKKNNGGVAQISDYGNPTTIELSMVATLIDQISSEADWKPVAK